MMMGVKWTCHIIVTVMLGFLIRGLKGIETEHHFFKNYRGVNLWRVIESLFNRRLHSLLGVIPIGIIPNAASCSEPLCDRMG